MKPRLFLVFVLLLATPLGVAGWLGVKMASEERTVLRARFRTLLEEPLRTAGDDIAGVLRGYEDAFVSLGPLSTKPREELQQLARHSGTVKQCFVLDTGRRLSYPDPGRVLDTDEAAFFERTGELWRRREIAFTSEETRVQEAVGKGSRSVKAVAAPVSKGWHTWHYGSRQHFLFWWHDETYRIVGVEVNWARLASDIISVLPHEEGDIKPLPEGCIALTNDRGERLYQWGGYTPEPDAKPAALYSLAYPLSSWRLEHYVPPGYALEGLGRGTRFNLLSGLAALTLATLALGWYFHRESARESREARQRVSFVNQVSHELKTPLTNIRMYAEMLDTRLEGDADSSRYVHVIVSESQRLSRLIGNVLTFGRKERGALRMHVTEGCVDAAVAEVIAQFQEALARQGVSLEFTPGAPAMCSFDADAVQQVLANLLSNAQKYAAGAREVKLSTEQTVGQVRIRVADDGPGIPRRERERIFAPFYRVSGRTTDGVTGTGIGLAISRDLARRHGGDLVLEPSTSGAAFVFTFQTVPAPPED